MNQDELLYLDNYSHWKRLGMMARLYWPSLRRAVILYPIIVLLLTLVCGAFTRIFGDWPAVFYSLPITIMFVCSPIILTYRNFQPVSDQLPVTAREKLGFMLLLFWVVFPALIFISGWIGEWLVSLIFHIDAAAAYSTVVGKLSTAHSALGFLTVYCILSITMYYNVTRRNSRAMATLVSAFAAYISFLVLTGVFMFCVGIYIGFQSAIASPEEAYVDQVADTILVQAADVWAYISFAAFMIIGFCFLRKLFKYLRNNGF